VKRFTYGHLMRNHKDLIAWQKAVALAHEVHELKKEFPREEMFGLVSQMRRAAISIPSNIAEGAARASTREFLQFLHVARGSFAELETQAELARRSRYVSGDHPIFARLGDVGRLINALIVALRAKLRK
jgi:four helix bundle protein